MKHSILQTQTLLWNALILTVTTKLRCFGKCFIKNSIKWTLAFILHEMASTRSLGSEMQSLLSWYT